MDSDAGNWSWRPSGPRLGRWAWRWRGLVAFVLAFGIVLVFAQLGRNRLGGMNGDVYGAIGEVVEVVILVLGSLAV